MMKIDYYHNSTECVRPKRQKGIIDSKDYWDSDGNGDGVTRYFLPNHNHHERVYNTAYNCSQIYMAIIFLTRTTCTR